MEATFHYTNIFATKGVEYLMVIAFMASFYMFVRSMRRPATQTGQMSLTSALHEGQATHAAPIVMDNPFAIPEGLFVAPGHAAARLELDGSLAFGSGPLPSYLMGEIDRVELTDKKNVQTGDILAVLHSGDKALNLRAPADGDIAALNTQAADNPELLADASLRQGWLLRMKPAKLQDALGNMYFAEEASAWMDSELQVMRDALTGLSSHPIHAMADGGLPVRGLAKELDAKSWKALEGKLFKV